MSLRPALAPRATSYPAPTGHSARGLRRKYLQGAESSHGLDQEVSVPRIPRRKLLVPSTLDSTVISQDALAPGPDIQWNPDYRTYVKRMDALAKSAVPRESTVPHGWPQAVREPWVWSGNEFTGPEGERRYIIALSAADIAEIETALAEFKKAGGGPGDVSQTTFPLPGLAARLEDVAKNLHNGFGFNVIRGVDPRRYSALENVLIYLGITSYVAPHRAVQDSGGSMIIHVKDLGSIIPDSDMRQSPYARNAQPFHNDVCDILAMYVQEAAAEGGESYLCSGAQIYNEIAATRPDVIHMLAKDDWIFDKHQTPAYWNTRALLFNFKGKGPGFCFSRRPITGSPTSPRSPGVPPMTEAQAEALDMVHFVGVKHQLSMRLQRGDIQLINNLAIFHARNGFRDNANQRRHIIRMWLRNEELAWETPPGLQRTWFEKYGDSKRRSIAKWNIEPGASRERVLYRSDSCS